MANFIIAYTFTGRRFRSANDRAKKETQAGGVAI
jgi:hypothetical protein